MILTCAVCGSDFLQPQRKRGLAKKYCSPRCNTKAWRLRHPENAAASARRTCAAIRKKRAEHPEAYKAKDAARYWSDPEKHRARVRARRSVPEIRERDRQVSAAWRAANQEKYHAAVRRWEFEHPDLKAHYQALRYARRKGNGGTHTLEQWRQKCAEYGNRCAYCGKDRPLTRDHVVPISKGGTDDISNIIPACQLCNSKKRTRTPEEFLRIRAAERAAT